MSARGSEADRLREARLVFERSMRDGITMQAAREALAREQWSDAEARLRQRQCGTAAPAAAFDRHESEHDLPEPWWQRL